MIKFSVAFVEFSTDKFGVEQGVVKTHFVEFVDIVEMNEMEFLFCQEQCVHLYQFQTVVMVRYVLSD